MLTQDGRLLVRGAGNGQVQVWDVAAGNLVRVVDIAAGALLALSPDGALLLARIHDVTSSAELWDLHTAAKLRTFSTEHFWAVESAAFLPDGRSVATGLEPYSEAYLQYECRETIIVWDVASGERTQTLTGGAPSEVGWPGVVQSLAITADGTRLASAPLVGPIRLWDIAAGACSDKIDLDESTNVVALSADGSRLAAGGNGGRVASWDMRGEPRIQDYTRLASGISAMAFSPDGVSLACGCWNGSIEVLDGLRGGWAFDAPATGDGLVSVAFRPDGQFLVTECESGRVAVFEVVGGRMVSTFDAA